MNRRHFFRAAVATVVAPAIEPIGEMVAEVVHGDFVFASSLDRPSPCLQEFMELLLRDVADGFGIPRHMLEDVEWRSAPFLTLDRASLTIDKPNVGAEEI